MPLIARQRSRFAVLAVLALVGSLLAVSAVPAVAAGDEKVSQPAPAKACVAAATDDAGFTDTDGNFAEDEVNCLAHYGIAAGTSEGVFSPNDSITRAQMALFMVRAAGVAGIELDDPEDQGLGDIGNWTDTIQDAINKAVGEGIMSGSDGAFNPTGSVSRQDMAVILRAFIEVNDDEYYDVDKETELDTPFTDLGTVPFSAYNAINELYELGVASGTGDGSTFAPGALVSRAQMAVFVTRALGHTNARPAGISVQGETLGATDDVHTLIVSIRDEDHQPVPDAVVDVFSSTTPSEAFDDDGSCVIKRLSDGDDCEIDDDPVTEPDGNVDVSVTLPKDPGSLTVWMWTGEVDDEFDADDTAFVSVEIDARLSGLNTELSDDLKKSAIRVKFGDTVTYTLQIVDINGDPVADEGLGVMVTATEDDTSDRTDTADEPGNGEKRGDIRTVETVYKTDAAGRIEFSYTADDPDSAKDSADQITLTLIAVPATDEPVPAVAVGGIVIKATDVDADEGGVQTIWTDAASVAETLVLNQAVSYHETNDDGVRNTVTATLVDQYGNPVRNQRVAFWSTVLNPDTGDRLGLGGSTDNDPETMNAVGSAMNPADHRPTSPSGVATKFYSRDDPAAGQEMLGAQYVLMRGDCLDSLVTCTDEGPTEAVAAPVDADHDKAINAAGAGITHYWVTAVSGDVGPSPVLVVDTDNNSIVLGPETGPRLVTYKAGDQFRIRGAAATMEAFEKALSVAETNPMKDPDQVAAVIGDDEDDINTFDIDPNIE